MNICRCITESLCYTLETNTLLINYTPIKFKKQKAKKPQISKTKLTLLVFDLFASSTWRHVHTIAHATNQYSFLCALNFQSSSPVNSTSTLSLSNLTSSVSTLIQPHWPGLTGRQGQGVNVVGLTVVRCCRLAQARR